MPGPKKALPAPVDKPLQKAYLREFTGWSTAYPPGSSDPTSCRVMENVYVKRNGSIAVRPGLRYMSYIDTPDTDPLQDAAPGLAFELPMVGSLEPFFLADGTKAMLFAMREKDGSVGFRVLVTSRPDKTVFTLTDPTIGFFIPQGEETLNFSSATKHVTYLQIDNKILALSDAGESMRLFTVGAQKVAKRLNSINVPEWDDTHKPTIRHPKSNWALGLAYSVRRNECYNPSFEAGFTGWSKGSTTFWAVPYGTGMDGRTALEMWTAPLRTNYAMSPLHNVSATGIDGWHSGKGDPKLSADGDWLKVFDPSGTDVVLAYSAKCSGIEEGKRYKLAFDFELAVDSQLRCRLQFYRNNGSEIGDQIKFLPEQKKGRWESPSIEAPNNAVAVRIYLGADSTNKGASWSKFKHVTLCRANESTDFFSGASADCQWYGTANASSSLYWPPQDITIAGIKVNVDPGKAVTGSAHVRAVNKSGNGVARQAWVDVFTNDLNRAHVAHARGSLDTSAGWQRMVATVNADPRIVVASVQMTIKGVQPHERVFLDNCMIESVPAVDTYFDGSTVAPAVDTQVYYTWQDPNAPHLCPSIRTEVTDPAAIPAASVPGANSLISSDATKNTFKMGFFYCFENEIGESAPSKIAEVRMIRPQANWLWVRPNANTDSSQPEGSPTDTADMCSDQLVAFMPEEVYDAALAAGALRWHLYTFSWSDQEPVPVEAVLAGTREIYPDETARLRNEALPYKKGGWINVTPSRKFTTDSQMLPTAANRVNYSDPPKARNGIVAGDRVIVVGEGAQIKWTTNRPGEYTNFTAHKGGGVKTLSAGNLHLPVSAQLWQNPQSVDTITLLCLGSDGTSSCYYMSPADANTQSSAVSVMGFEETTNTPGTTSPYGVIVHNNALFRPIDRALLKSTAQNYNINHKQLSDDIANMWEELQFKNNIIAAEHDNRLYFLVNNPRGEMLEEGCLGNEVWVYDTAGGEAGTWSRWLTQGCDLRIIEYGTMVYIGLCRPEGVYYFDYNARQDDYVRPERYLDPSEPEKVMTLVDATVYQRPIPWFFEMNTQGSNRARDAWAHLQQVSVMFGDFEGSVVYGLRGKTVNGKTLEVSKRFDDFTVDLDNGLRWDVEDHLLVRRDLKEWYFFAGSVDGQPSSGAITYVQYRFTPVTVNVGYEYGSVETFEYRRDAGTQGSSYSTGGVPTPMQDRDWQRT